MVKCVKCGAEIVSGSKFCPECGEPVSRVEPPTTELRKTEDRFESAINSTGRYKVRKLIGRGGMGLVYLAYDKELGIEVAIKTLPPELSGDARSLEQLRQEAKLSMQLTHQGIVRLYDLKEARDLRLLVMEYIPGFNLSDYLFLRGKLSEDEAWEILTAVASALDYAHSQKVIHRDIKPSNILFKTTRSIEEVAEYYQREKKFPSDVEFKVADFGIARTVSDSVSRLSNMPVSGTLTYMSSEQIRGKRQTSATDVYSLAVVAYELLCGHPPFYQGEITYQIINEPPDLIPDIKPEYMQALLIALSKDPEQRPKSCMEFIELPKKLSADKSKWALIPQAPPEPARAEPYPAQMLSQPEPAPAPSSETAKKKSSARILVISIGILLLLGILGAGGYFALKYTKGTRAFILGKTEEAPKSRVQLLWSAGKNDPYSSHKARVSALCISPDGGIVASGSDDKSIKLWSAQKGKLIKTLEGHSSALSALRFSPKGSILASGSKDGKMILWSTRSWDLLNSIDTGIGELNSIAFSPDGAFVASASSTSIKIWDVQTGKLYKKMGGLLGTSARVLAWSPAGKTLASGGLGYKLKLWDIETGKDISTIKGPEGSQVYCLAFSPGGSLLASGGSDRDVRIWNVSEAKLVQSLSGHDKAVSAVVFGPDGKVIISASADESIKIWRISGGVLLESIKAHPVSSLCLRGELLASGGCPSGEGTSCKTGELRLYKINW